MCHTLLINSCQVRVCTILFKNPPQHLAAGKIAETIAKKYLTSKGLELIERNFRTKNGEIDLIMRDGLTIVFVEVRYRKNTRFGLPHETVTIKKQRKILKAAQLYLIEKHLFDEHECRFDIVAIHGTIPNHNINWITDAFYAQI